MFVTEQRARYAILSATRPPKNPHRAMRIKDTYTLLDVFRKLCRILDREGLLGEMDYFSTSGVRTESIFRVAMEKVWRYHAKTPYDGYRWWACYAVTGGSEGHYIHIDLASGYGEQYTGTTFHVITGKTFMGMEHALKVANRCAELLGA